MLILDIKKDQKTSLECFTRLQAYKNNLKVHLAQVKKNGTHTKKKINLLEKELIMATRSVREIFEGKKNYTSIEYNSKINKN